MNMKKFSTSLVLVLLISTLLLFGCSSDTTSSSSNDTKKSEKTTVSKETTAEETTTTDGSTESSATVEETTTATSGTEVMSFTKDELAMYDGKNGNPAYIAVDGVVYDVTNESRWSSGTHESFKAGQDLTSAFDTKSPHSSSIFDGVPVVGVYTG